MGLFLGLSCVIGSKPEDVASAISLYVQSKEGTFEIFSSGEDQSDVMSICHSNENVSVLYPDWDSSWQEASQEISKTLKRPVFALHIHDDDFWMYSLFKDGIEIDAFNPIPDYWTKNISADQRQRYRGNAPKICKCVPGVRPGDIKNYLVNWNSPTRRFLQRMPGNMFARAYPKDKYAYGNCWQMTDFMKRLNLPYNSEGQFPEALYIYKIPKQFERPRKS